MSETSKLYLSDVADIVTGSTPITSNVGYWNGSIPFYSPVDFDGSTFCKTPEKFVTELGAKTGRLIPSGAIMITCIGSIGKMAICGIAGITNQQINTLITKPNYDVSYVYYLVLNNVNKLKQFAPQTTIPILNKTDFGKFQFNFHQYHQQIQISEILRSIDQAIEKTEALIEKYQQIKAGLMHDLFTRGIGADGKLRPPREQAPEFYQQTPIGWIPKHWQIKTIQELDAIVTSGSRDWAQYYSEDGDIFIRIGNLTREHINFKLEKVQYVIPPLNSDGQRTKLEFGDILFSITADLGVVGLVPESLGDAYINQHIALIRFPDGNINKKFIAHFFTCHTFQNFVASLNDSGAKAGLNLPTIRSMPVVTVNPSEQKKISDKLDYADRKIFEEKKYLEKLKQQKSGLMHDLLTGKVQVPINTAEAEHV